MYGMFLIRDRQERALFTVGNAIPGLVVLGYITKQAEQAMGDKPVSSTPPWPLHQLLPALCMFLQYKEEQAKYPLLSPICFW